MRRLPILAALALLFVSPAAHAGFIGANLNAVYYLPDTSTPYPQAAFSPLSFVVGPGQETDGNVENATHLLVDFTDTQLTITLKTILSNPTWLGVSFNGPIFTLQTPGSLGIVSSTVNAATTMSNFDNSRVTFSDTQIGINWQGLSYVDGTKVVVDFAFVPEPSSIIALGVGYVLPVVASLRRRRRRIGA